MLKEKSFGEDGAPQVHIHADGDFGLDDGVDIAKSGTSHDARDMWRVGRQQELNVSPLKKSTDSPTLADQLKAKLSIHLHPRIHCRADVNLGSRSYVRKAPRNLFRENTEVLRSGASFGLINGGPAGMVWTYIGAVFGFGTAILSMAEMASM